MKKVTTKLVAVSESINNGTNQSVRELLTAQGIAVMTTVTCEADLLTCVVTLTMIDSESAEKFSIQGAGHGKDLYSAQMAAEAAAWSLAFGKQPTAKQRGENHTSVDLSRLWSSMKNIGLDEAAVLAAAAKFFGVDSVSDLKELIKTQRDLNKFMSYCAKSVKQAENDEAAG